MKKLKEIIQAIEPINTQLMEKAQKRLDNLTKPRDSLGKLESLAKRVVGITAKENPPLEKKVIFTMAGDHGVAEEGVSAFPQDVTPQMVYNFLNGGAAINVLARGVGAKVIIVDMGVAVNLEPHPDLLMKKIGHGTKNIARGPAMTGEEAVEAITTGIMLFEDELNRNGIDIMGTGDMGIGNTTPSSAIVACLTGAKVKDVTGRGTGIGDAQLQNKIRVIETSLEINRPNPQDPLDVLSKVGGYEIGGLAGCILAAARYKVPIVIDGFISTASALIAASLAPLVKERIFAAHKSVEKGHKIALDYLNQPPLFDLNMRLGEGTGAALGMNLLDLSVKILTQMATFEGAGVSTKSAKRKAKNAKP